MPLAAASSPGLATWRKGAGHPVKNTFIHYEETVVETYARAENAPENEANKVKSEAVHCLVNSCFAKRSAQVLECVDVPVVCEANKDELAVEAMDGLEVQLALEGILFPAVALPPVVAVVWRLPRLRNARGACQPCSAPRGRQGETTALLRRRR